MFYQLGYGGKALRGGEKGGGKEPASPLGWGKKWCLENSRNCVRMGPIFITVPNTRPWCHN